MARGKWKAAATGALMVSAGAGFTLLAGVASATFQPTVLYDPPLLKLLDHPSHQSQEDIVVRRDGQLFTLTNPFAPPVADPASEPGCEPIPNGVSCPRTGVQRIVVLLGAMNDSADVGLGRSAEKVKQIIKGQDGEDDLAGGRGTQRLKGGEHDDTLHGGPGPDLLIGGKGTDICDGGPGRDEFIGCEAAPAR